MVATPSRPFEAVIFDLGSTLIYFDGNINEVSQGGDAELLTRLKEAGFQIDGPAFLAAFRSRLGMYFAEREAEFIEYTTAYFLRDVLAEFGYQSVPDEIVRPALAAMYAVTQAYWQVEADALPTVVALRQLGYRIGLISNAADDDDVQTLVDKARLRPHLEVILSSARQGFRKPSPRIFHTALDSMGVSPEHAVMVGDKLGADILGAQLAGMKAIWITRRADSIGNRSHQDTIQPDAVIATLTELPQALLTLGRT